MITKEQKQAMVGEIEDLVKGASSLYFVDFSGVDVAMDRKIRREFMDKGVTMRVSKNTLILRALNNVGGYEVTEEMLFGQTAVIYGGGDPLAPAKIIRQHFDKVAKPRLKLAIIEGQMFDGSRLKEVSELPTREELIAAIVGSIHAPISGIVGSINAVMRDVASLIEEVAKKKAA